MATRPSTDSNPSKASTGDRKADSKMRPKSVSASERPGQDGPETEQASKSQAPTAVQPVEPEDAYLTGVSRSLQRRLLGLNVQGSQGQSKPLPEADTAGLHSTGSHTGSGGVKAESSKRKPK